MLLNHSCCCSTLLLSCTSKCVGAALVAVDGYSLLLLLDCFRCLPPPLCVDGSEHFLKGGRPIYSFLLCKPCTATIVDPVNPLHVAVDRLALVVLWEIIDFGLVIVKLHGVDIPYIIAILSQ
jgi:hypothetical protein